MKKQSNGHFEIRALILSKMRANRTKNYTNRVHNGCKGSHPFTLRMKKKDHILA